MRTSSETDESRLNTLAALVRIDSRTETPHESDVCAWVEEEVRRLGMEVEVVQSGPGRSNVVGVLRGTGQAPSLMFNGHLDTNPLGNGWTVDPWGGVIDDSFIYGLGVSNMKAGCAAYLVALRDLISQGWKPAGDVILTFVVGELQHGVGTRAVLEAGYGADYFVNCEPTDLVALTGHAGAFTFEIELSGVTRHMSKREDASDAVAVLAALTPQINALTFSGAANASAVLTNRAHVGTVHAGLGPERLATRPPLVADGALLRGSARYGPGQTLASALGDLQATVDSVCQPFLAMTGTVRSITDSSGPAMDIPFSSEFNLAVESLNQAYKEVVGKEQETGVVRPYCFYGSDASLLQHLGNIAGVVSGPGGHYNTMPDERVEIEQYLQAIEIYSTVMQRMCG